MHDELFAELMASAHEGGAIMRKLISFEDWEAERLRDPAFVAAAKEHEAAYQIARLRTMRELTGLVV